MRLNNDPLEEPVQLKKACIRDMHELVTKHLPEAMVKLAPLKQLKRRLKEIDNEYPHLQEETPLVLQFETRRRAQHKGLLVVAGSRKRAMETASQVYFHG